MPEQNNNIWGNLPSSQAEALANLMRGGAYFLLEAANYFENQTDNGTASQTPHQRTQSGESLEAPAVTSPTEKPTNAEADTETVTAEAAEAETVAAEALMVMHSPKEQKHPVDDELSVGAPVPASGESTIWPNGDHTFFVPKDQCNSEGIPYFGYALSRYGGTRNNKLTGGVHRSWYCLGVMSCSESNCQFVLKPALPNRLEKRLGAPPSKASLEKYCCPIHPEAMLQWIPCNSDDKGTPCRIHSETTSTGEVIVTHVGNHNHVRPPRTKPSPAELAKFKKRVAANPSAGVRQLLVQSETNESITKISHAFTNKNRSQYYKGKAMKEIKSLPNNGIVNTFSGFLQFLKDIPQTFLVDTELANSEENILTFQTDYMRDLLREAVTGFQSDTIEGVIHDLNYSGNIDIHFTAAYDQYLGRWAPGLISIMFGRKNTNYARHFKVLFSSIKDHSDIETWEDFTNQFPGVTCDWSDALGKGYCTALLSHAHTYEDGKNVCAEDILPFFRKCDVHFKRSVLRIQHNGAVIQSRADRRVFDDYLETLLSGSTDLDKFLDTAYNLCKRFPKAQNWMTWFLHKDRAPNFFPACQTSFESIDKERFYGQLPSSTNAQENLGKQFKEMNNVRGGNKLELNSAAKAAYSFAIFFADQRRLVFQGVSHEYTAFNRSSPKRTKRRMHKSDGPPEKIIVKSESVRNIRPKSKAAATVITTEEKQTRGATWPFKAWHWRSETKFVGPKWSIPDYATNTCPLESLLVALYAPWHAKQLVFPWSELRDETSLLRRAFDLFDKNQSDEARKLWIEELVKTRKVRISSMFTRRTRVIDIFGPAIAYIDEGGVISKSITLYYQYEGPHHCTRGSECFAMLRDPEHYPVTDKKLRKTSMFVISTENEQVSNQIDNGEVVDFALVLDHKLGSVQLEGCRSDGVTFAEDGYTLDVDGNIIDDPEPSAQRGVKHCTGPSIRSTAQVTEWPPFILIDTGGSYNLRLHQIPRTFVYRNKKMVLRSLVCYGRSHFVATIPTGPSGWMLYDGLGGEAGLFTLYEDHQTELAASHRSVSFCFYEVFESSTPPEEFWNDIVDWGATFAVSNPRNPFPTSTSEDSSSTSGVSGISLESSNNNKPTQKETNKQLTSLAHKIRQESKQQQAGTPIARNLKRTSTQKAKRAASQKRKATQQDSPTTKKKKSVTSKARADIPFGFSYRKHPQTHGKLPICRGCQQPIEKNEYAIRHKFKRNKRFIHPDVMQYHLSAECLMVLKEDHLREFMQKIWTDKAIKETVDEIRERKNKNE